ncbi:MAG: hypothetical protein QOG06_1963 [Gaiellaceae bacterium]|nr:hypothetical protein [Gaiellaceae bacterium]
MAEATSRIAAARRRASDVKHASVTFAAAGFIAIALLARLSHPGHASSASQGSTASVQPAQSTQNDDSSPSLQSGSIAPSSGSTGGAQTSVS